jgi:hypothetical protein
VLSPGILYRPRHLTERDTRGDNPSPDYSWAGSAVIWRARHSRWPGWEEAR